MLLGAEKLPPKRLGVLEAPKAGVLEAPKRLVPDDAPNEGVLVPNKEGVLAADQRFCITYMQLAFRGSSIAKFEIPTHSSH